MWGGPWGQPSTHGDSSAPPLNLGPQTVAQNWLTLFPSLPAAQPRGAAGASVGTGDFKDASRESL